MKLSTIDASGVTQTIIVNGVAEVADRSGTIETPGISQELLAANPDRGGWFFQNLGAVQMMLSEIGDEADPDTSFRVAPLGTFPPPNYPVTVGVISVRADNSGDEATDAVGAQFICREW